MIKPVSGSHPSLSSQKLSALRRVRFLAHLLDNSIRLPGINFRVGINPIIGLFPGAGDIIGLILAGYVVLEAARFGLSGSTLARMIFNVLLEATVGSVPVLGDAFDFVWKASAQNLSLLEAHLQDPVPHKAADQRFMGLVLLILIAVVGMAIALVSLILYALASMFSFN
jgi:hypothetical protein